MHLSPSLYDRQPAGLDLSTLPVKHVAVAPRVAGYAAVSLAALKKKLGRSFYLWQALLSRRDAATGLVLVKLTTLARFMPELATRGARATRDVLKKHLDHLTRAGLVKPVQWTRKADSGAWVKARLVLGDDGPTDVVRVPLRTSTWLIVANDWGGKRKHAGRKKSNQDDPRSGRFADSRRPTF